jgi:hypothetical protein
MTPLTKGEKMVLRFLRKFAFNIAPEDFRYGIDSTRKLLKDCNGSYKKGLFFKTLLAEVSRDIDWKLASEMEDAFALKLN